MSFGFGFALPAYPLRGGGGNNPFNQLGPTLDLSFAGVVTDQSDPNGYTLNTNFIIPQYQIAAQYVVWETGVGLVDKTFSQIITFTRASGATWFNAAGNLVGVDFSVTSVTIGTGSKTFTLDATAGVNRSWAVGDSVLISQQSNSANNMTGTVTSYTASTQALVVDVTSTGGSGTITSWRVSSLTPRFDYNPSTLAAQGLLIEESRTNSLLQSADFTTTWSQTNVTITANATASPDGGTNGDGLLTTSAGASIGQTSQSFTAGSTITFSVFAKKNASNFLRVELGNIVSCWWNLNTGATASNNAGSGNVLFSAKSIQAISNGWYRCVLTVTTSTVTTLLTSIYATDTDGNTSSINSSVFLWGAQLEVGAFPTSYIPTTVAQVTRDADVASVNTLSPWYNASAGTVYAEATGPIANIYRILAEGASAADFRDFSLSFDGLRGNFTSRFVTGNFDVLGPANSLTAGATVKLAGSYSSTSADLAYGGTLAVTKNAVTQRIPADRIFLGSRLGTSLQLNGHLRRLTYYPRTLSTAELQAITA
jgi:hypothetical protein